MALRRLLFALVLTAVLAAQDSPRRSHGYAFAGPVIVPSSPFTRWDGTFVHVGAGGDAALGRHIGLGGEIGLLAPTSNQFAITTGVLTGGVSYHLSGAGQRIDPFVSAGAGALVSSGGAGILYGGGGVNYWLKERLGLRLEFRYHHWPHSDGPVRFLGFRAALAFR
jgi:hypothetical protein